MFINKGKISVDKKSHSFISIISFSSQDSNLDIFLDWYSADCSWE